MRVEEVQNDDLGALRRILDDETWTPLPAPRTGYPRLVRCGVSKPLYLMMFGPDIAETKVAERLASLSRHFKIGDSPPFGGKRLENEVLALATAFGAPHTADQNTLAEWMILGLEAQTNFDAMGRLRDMGMEDVHGFLDARETEWRKRYSPRLSEPFSRSYGGPYIMILAAFERSTSPAGFRREMHRLEMGRSLGGVSVEYVADLHGLATRMTMRHRMRFEIAQAWGRGGAMGVCEGCGRWFPRTRRNRRYCQDRCRVRAADTRGRQQRAGT